MNLRERFEETETFKQYAAIKSVTYDSFGGYFSNNYPCFWLNGAFEMFQELNK